MRTYAALLAASASACALDASELPGGAPPPQIVAPMPNLPVVAPIDPLEVDPTKTPRLIPQYIGTRDGAVKRFLQFYDRQLQQSCRLSEMWGEKPPRCLPRGIGWVVYRDSNCSGTPLISTNYSEGDWVLGQGVEPLVGPMRVGPPAQPQETLYMGGGRYPCWRVQPEMALHEIGEILPEESAGAGTFETVPVNDQIAAYTFKSPDGSEAIFDLVDRISGARCNAEMTSAGTRCKAEIDYAIPTDFMDPSCQRRGVLADNLGPVAEIVRSGGIYRFEPAGDQTTVARASLRCQLETIDTGDMTLYFGAPYPPEEWPVLEERTLQTRTLATKVTATPEGRILEPASRVVEMDMFEQNGIGCTPLWVQDSLRCVPVRADALDLAPRYADARCSEPAFSTFGSGEPPELLAFGAEATEPGRAGLPVVRVFRLGEEMEAPGYMKIAGSCEETGHSGRWFRLGAEVSTEAFPELQLTLEP